MINPAFSGIEFDSDAASIPIGIAYVGSYLAEKGIEVKIIDCLTDPNAREHIAANLRSSTWAGLSFHTSQVPNGLEICSMIRGIDPDLPIVWGGPHPTLFPEQTVLDPLVDIAVRNEGEETALELTHALEKGKPLDKLEGISFKDRQHGRPRSTPRRKFMPIDSLPYINYGLFNHDVLRRLDLLPCHTSRGCPHRCSFCINPITGCGWRGMSPKRVLDELEQAVGRFPGKPVRFWDENFFAHPKRAEEIMRGMLERKIDVRWESTMRADYFRKFVNDEYLTLMKKSGCYKLSFGAESGSPRILEKIKKDVTVEELVLSAQKCGQFGIKPEYSFMIGLPGEAREDMQKTIDLIYKLYEANPRAELIGPQPFRPYPGSPLYDECLAAGWKAPASLSEWRDIIADEWNFLSPSKLPWIKDPDFVEALWPFLNFALTEPDKLLKKGVKTNLLFKLLFMAASRLRWKARYFDNPIEYKLAKAAMAMRRKGKRGPAL